MPNGEVTIFWGDGQQTFNVAPLAQLLELEDKCRCGVRELLTRIAADRWYINDLRETLRLGLIGGGKDPEQAHKLIERYFDNRPKLESARPAFAVLAAALVGVPEDDVGKKAEADQTKAEGAAVSSETTDASSGPQSTVSAQPSDGPHATSTA
jgi:hypothetical protein